MLQCYLLFVSLELVFFIIRDTLPVVTDETGVVQHVRLIDKLIQRIDHINEDVSTVTVEILLLGSLLLYSGLSCNSAVV